GAGGHAHQHRADLRLPLLRPGHRGRLSFERNRSAGPGVGKSKETIPPMDKKTCPTCRSEIEAAAFRCPHCRARQPDMPAMHRDVPGRLLAGVCAAIGRELQVDATMVRIAFAVGCLVSGGLVFGAYVMIWLLTPFQASGRAP